MRANVTYGHYSHQIAYAASETPERPAQQALSSVAHPSFRATPWFCFRLFSCVVPVVSRQVSRPKEKKKVKKRGKEKGKKKNDFFFSSERAKTSLLFRSTMRRQVLGQPVGKNERKKKKERISASRPSVQSPPALA